MGKPTKKPKPFNIKGIPKRIDVKPSFAPKGSDAFPNFSLKHICTDKFCMKNCDEKQLKGIADKLRILSSLTWQQINNDNREANGYEPLPVTQIKATLPSAVSNAEKILVFRFKGGRGGRLAGIRRGDTFHILFVESTFKDLYDH